MATEMQLQQNAEGGHGVRLSARPRGSPYKAFKRPYTAGGVVLSLIASGYYDIAPWELTFSAVIGSPGKYQLMEKVPSIFFGLTTFYTPCMCSTYGIADPGEFVTVQDSFGEHKVHIEEFPQIGHSWRAGSGRPPRMTR